MAAFLSLLVSLLLSTTLAHGVEELNSHQAGQGPPSKIWYNLGNCIDRTEPCLGTFVWCSIREYYTQEGYHDQDACFKARPSRSEWKYISTGGCLENSENCEGTDVVCSRVSNSTYRGLCYNAHSQARYFEPFSEGCLDARRVDDERCVGTKEFCTAQERISSYGSTQICLGYRDKPALSSETTQKKPFLLENSLLCTGDPTEPCLGTEKFCGKLSGQKRQQCFESYQRPPFFSQSSAECETSRQKGVHSEPCVGTVNWCKNKNRIPRYGSEDACREFRKAPEKPEKGKWIPANHTCLANPNGAGQCEEGTEELCLLHSENPESCFEARENPIFHQPGSEGCPSPEIADERCMGTEKWCWLKQRMYGSATACLDRRELPTKLASFRSYSRECRGSAEFDTEACRGTENWCKDAEKREMYGSEERCRSYRGDIPERSAWLYGEAATGCSDETEQCLGTYKACSLFKTDELKQSCFGGRNPPGELSDLDDCRYHGAAEEHCMQIIDQCYTRYGQTGYANVTECLNSDGLDLQLLNSTIFEELAGAAKNVIVETGKNLVQYVALQHLYYENGTVESTKAAAKSALASYMGKTEAECDQAINSAMDSLVSR